MEKSIIMILTVALWGCGSDTNPNTGDSSTVNDDGGSSSTTTGNATVTASVDGDKAVGVVITGPDDIEVFGNTGEKIDVPASDKRESYTVKFGSYNNVGCDDQLLMDDGSTMALVRELKLSDGDEKNISQSSFPYYEWDGRLQCTAWDDYGWEYDYDPNDATTDNGTTCVDSIGRLFIGGDAINLSTSTVTTGNGGTITDFQTDADGLFATFMWDGEVTYFDCVVVD